MPAEYDFHMTWLHDALDGPLAPLYGRAAGANRDGMLGGVTG